MTAIGATSPTAPHVLLATLGVASLDLLAATLAGRGERVAVLEQADGANASGGDSRSIADVGAVARLAWDASTRESTRRSVDELLGQGIAPTQLVVHALPVAALTSEAVAQQDEATWHASSGLTMQQTIHLLQALAPPLKALRASIVFVGPSLGLVGAERLGGLVTLLESQRGLMKSLARQWGRYGITSNWIALEASELWAGLADFNLPVRLEAVPVALGRRPNAGVDLAGTLDYLSSPAGRALTGATLCLDGGEWMVP